MCGCGSGYGVGNALGRRRGETGKKIDWSRFHALNGGGGGHTRAASQYM